MQSETATAITAVKQNADIRIEPNALPDRIVTNRDFRFGGSSPQQKVFVIFGKSTEFSENTGKAAQNMI